MTFEQAKQLVPVGVLVDPLTHTTIRSLAWQVQDQVDLYDEGEESDASRRSIAQFRRAAKQLWQAAEPEEKE